MRGSPKPQPASGRAVWARGVVFSFGCPKSVITAQSLYFVEQFGFWKQFGGTSLWHLQAKSAEALILLDEAGEWRIKVAKSKNNASGLTKGLPSVNTGRQNVSRLRDHTDLVSQIQAASEKAANIPASGDQRHSSINGYVPLHSIQFGRPSQASSNAPSTSGSEWTNLLKQTASSGIASVLSGGLSSIGGLGPLISGIVSLFGGDGGKKMPPPLVEFKLPSSQEQTVYVGSRGRNVYQGTVAESATAPLPGAGVYSNAGQLADQRIFAKRAMDTRAERSDC